MVPRWAADASKTVGGGKPLCQQGGDLGGAPVSETIAAKKTSVAAASERAFTPPLTGRRDSMTILPETPGSGSIGGHGGMWSR